MFQKIKRSLEDTKVCVSIFCAKVILARPDVNSFVEYTSGRARLC